MSTIDVRKEAQAIHSPLREVDPDIAGAIRDETHRQNTHIMLIASENYASAAILEAEGSVLTNKYAEGYPGKRYYGGCENIDAVESLAIARAKELYGAEHANVQPHSGSQANQAVYFAFMKPGDRYLAMELAHGGHLTHGSPVNFSGILYRPCHYGVDRETEMLDYEAIEQHAESVRPTIIMTGATAYPRIIDFARFRRIADKVGAILVADMAHLAGLVAAGEHPSPVPHCDVVTFTTHKTLRGPRSGMILCKEKFARTIDRAVFPGMQGGPFGHTIAAKAVALKQAMEPSFKTYQQQVVANSKKLASVLVEHGIRLVSGGTDNHLMVADLTSRGLTGNTAQDRLNEVGIVVSKSMIPFDAQKPAVTSGIRIGTPCITTRGMRDVEMEKIGEMIVRCLRHAGESANDVAERERISREVSALAAAFPVY